MPKRRARGAAKAAPAQSPTAAPAQQAATAAAFSNDPLLGDWAHAYVQGGEYRPTRADLPLMQRVMDQDQAAFASDDSLQYARWFMERRGQWKGMADTFFGCLPDEQLFEVFVASFWGLSPTWAAVENLREYVEGNYASIAWVLGSVRSSIQELRGLIRDLQTAHTTLGNQVSQLEGRLGEHIEDARVHLQHGTFAYRSNKAAMADYTCHLQPRHGPWSPNFDAARILFELLGDQLRDLSAQLNTLHRTVAGYEGHAGVQVSSELAALFRGLAERLEATEYLEPWRPGVQGSRGTWASERQDANTVLRQRIEAAQDEAARSRAGSWAGSYLPSRMGSRTQSGTSTPHRDQTFSGLVD